MRGRHARHVPVEISPARADRLWARVSERLARAEHRKPRARAAGLVLALSAAAFAGGWWLATPSHAPRAAEVVTSGSPVRLTLGDGSRLELASETRITLDDADPRRVAVALAQGSVDCTVAHRPERSFSVSVLDYQVVARGTRFSVSLERSRPDVGVVLHEGKVDIYRGGTSEPEASMSAGQRWSSSAARELTVAQRPVEPAPASDAGSPAEPGASHAAPRPSRSPDHEQAPRRLLDRGNTLRREGDLVGAARTYETLLRRYPADARAGLAAFELGRLRMDRLQDLPGAIQALEQAARLLGDAGLREDAMARRVRALDEVRDQERCLAARAAYLEQHPAGIHVRPVASACGVGR